MRWWFNVNALTHQSNCIYRLEACGDITIKSLLVDLDGVRSTKRLGRTHIYEGIAHINITAKSYACTDRVCNEYNWSDATRRLEHVSMTSVSRTICDIASLLLFLQAHSSGDGSAPFMIGGGGTPLFGGPSTSLELYMVCIVSNSVNDVNCTCALGREVHLHGLCR